MSDRTRVLTHSALLASLLVLAAAAPQARAEHPGEPDSELWVDGPLAVKPGGDPRYPDAAVDYRGRKIFVWDSNGGVAGQDVFMRIFDVGGTPLIDPVTVNTYTDSTQDLARIAVAADNSFLVIWQSGEPPMPEDNFDRRVVRSQAYDADGQKVGSERVLSALLPEIAIDISANVSALGGGGYVACWESDNTQTAGFNNITIQARLVNPDGTPNGDQFQVNALYTGSVRDCDVAPLADGGFVVVWANPEIHARRFAANGTPVGDEFQVNTIAVNAPRDESAVASSDDGRVLIVWTDSEGTDTTPGTVAEVRGRLFGSTLAALGPDFRINSLVDGNQDWPKVAGYGDNFFVLWQSESSVGPDNEPDSIEGRVVNGVDSFAGPQMLINTWTVNSQGFPGIGGVGDRVAMAWRSQDNAETTQNVIQGLGWHVCGIFCDRFE
ncbi:hypothetical protein G4Y73_03020 [Wenzhouxiangella sp. XN201]|uniref:hypothetical protein n=1 Tax=Wenzhouxiangella sp. XN201 TaxID=2710755 RepID=UPI0013C57F0E|nr:hypothetical protein [Wenzhouxiangella sp. XN201]NEZ03120.1 hypothetical protein [Wenzhouxiangella sp. XN201]